jgi:hypothetical protein
MFAILRACQPAAGEMTPLACEVVPPGGQAIMSLPDLSGIYTLSLTAETGPKAGSSTAGRLRLQPFDQATRSANPLTVQTDPNARYVLFGSATLALDSIGAVAPGPLDLEQADRPGVLGIEWRSGGDANWSALLRLGSDANAGGAARFDGAYLTLVPTRIDPAGFAGRWESGGERVAAGYFCAVREVTEGR